MTLFGISLTNFCAAALTIGTVAPAAAATIYSNSTFTLSATETDASNPGFKPLIFDSSLSNLGNPLTLTVTDSGFVDFANQYFSVQTHAGDDTLFIFSGGATDANGNPLTFELTLSGLPTAVALSSNDGTPFSLMNGVLTTTIGSTSFKETDFNLAQVPEPNSWLMMAAGFGLLGGVLRRARRSDDAQGVLAAR